MPTRRLAMSALVALAVGRDEEGQDVESLDAVARLHGDEGIVWTQPPVGDRWMEPGDPVSPLVAQ